MVKKLRFLINFLQFYSISNFLISKDRDDLLFFIGSTVIFQASRLFVILIAAVWISPEQLGLWNILSLLLIYGITLTFGVLNGMNREIPFQIGKGNINKANYIADQAFTFLLTTLALLTIIILLTLIIEFNHILQDNFIQGINQNIFFWSTILLLFWQIYTYFQMRLKSFLQFTINNIQQTIFALLLPTIALPMTYVWGFNGLIIGHSVTVIAICLFLAWKIQPKIQSFQFSIINKLFKTGFPIMIAGFLHNILTSIDRWIVFSRIGITELGVYSIATISFSTVSTLILTISQLFYPRIVRHYGQTNNVHSLKKLVQQQILLSLLMSLPIILFLYLVIPYFVREVMPEYIQGVQAAQIVLFGIIFYAVASGIGNFLNTISQQNTYLITQIIAIVVNYSLCELLIKLGYGLEGAALGTVLTYLLYATILWIIFQRHIKK